MKYYYNKDGKNYGPVTIEELFALAEQGEIQPQTPVIAAGTKEWTSWGALQESLQGEPEPAPAPAPQRPAAAARPRVAARPSAKAAASASDKGAFINKIPQVYDMIDRMCEKICYLPGGVVDTPEQYKKNLSFLNAIAGVGTILCVICFILANGLYLNIGVLLGLLVAGAVIQYICYQMYSAMMPLLFGKKIKLSSLWLPRTLALFCVLLILAYVLLNLKDTGISSFLMNLGPVLILLGVGYSCVNCTKLSVEVCPEDVVPGREFLNLGRFIARVVFTTVHVLTPFYMILAALALLFSGQKDMLPPGVTPGFDSVFMLATKHSIENAFMIAVLPIFTLPLFYLFSFIPDFFESFFTKGDSKSN